MTDNNTVLALRAIAEALQTGLASMASAIIVSVILRAFFNE